MYWSFRKLELINKIPVDKSNKFNLLHRRLVVDKTLLLSKTNHDLQVYIHHQSWQYLLHTACIASLYQQVDHSGHSHTWRFFHAIYLFYLGEVCFLWRFILVVLHRPSSLPPTCVFLQFWLENGIAPYQLIYSLMTERYWRIQVKPWRWTISFLPYAWHAQKSSSRYIFEIPLGIQSWWCFRSNFYLASYHIRSLEYTCQLQSEL